MPYTPALVTTPESTIEIGDGATAWASASGVWNGTIKLFTPNPATISPKDISVVGVSLPASMVASCAMLSVWHCRYIRAMPVRMNPDPTEHITRYLRAASRAPSLSVLKPVRATAENVMISTMIYILNRSPVMQKPIILPQSIINRV